MLNGGAHNNGEYHHRVKYPAGVQVLFAAPPVEAVLFENQIDKDEGGKGNPSYGLDMEMGNSRRVVNPSGE